MQPAQLKSKIGEEAKIQDSIIRFLKIRDWYVMETHGNMFQRGFPDLFATHSVYGQRWVEVKKPTGYQFTAAQLECFPKICAHGSGVWIMTAASDLEYACLFRECNWFMYLMQLNLRSL